MKQENYILTSLVLLTSLFTYGRTETTQQTFEGYYQICSENSAFFYQNIENLHKHFWFEFDSCSQNPDSLTNLEFECVSFVDTLTGMKIYSFVDSMPKPKEGELNLFEKIKGIKVKPICGEIRGSILVAFIVDIDGNLIGKRIIKNIEGTDFAEQVLTLIDDVEWIVGTCQGNLVPVIYQLPIKFS